MKKLLIMAVAACCLAACNKELGPEYIRLRP
jgi:predicted small secreted protein